MLEVIYWMTIIGLIGLFSVSFFLFVRRLLHNSSIRKNETVKNGDKLDLIIEQNERIISMLEKDN